MSLFRVRTNNNSKHRDDIAFLRYQCNDAVRSRSYFFSLFCLQTPACDVNNILIQNMYVACDVFAFVECGDSLRCVYNFDAIVFTKQLFKTNGSALSNRMVYQVYQVCREITLQSGNHFTLDRITWVTLSANKTAANNLEPGSPECTTNALTIGPPLCCATF